MTFYSCFRYCSSVLHLLYEIYCWSQWRQWSRDLIFDVLTWIVAFFAFVICNCYICINRSIIMFYYFFNHDYEFSFSSTFTQYIWSSSFALETTRSQIHWIDRNLSSVFFVKASEHQYNNYESLLVISRFSNKRSHIDQFVSLRQEAIMRNIEFFEFQISVRRFDISFDIFIFDLNTSTRDKSIIFDFEIFAFVKCHALI